jgi:hypothetical protein
MYLWYCCIKCVSHTIYDTQPTLTFIKQDCIVIINRYAPDSASIGGVVKSVGLCGHWACS